MCSHTSSTPDTSRCTFKYPRWSLLPLLLLLLLMLLLSVESDSPTLNLLPSTRKCGTPSWSEYCSTCKDGSRSATATAVTL